MFRITCQDGRSFAAELGETVLAAALRVGIDFPHSCQAGNCGACRCRLAQGEVDIAPHSEFALSEAQRQSGQILACRAVPWSDCEIELLDEEDRVVHPQRVLDCEVVAIEDATHDIRILKLRIIGGGPFHFSPGQYANLEAAGLPPRPFSMATQPGREELAFHVRRVEGGAFTGHVFGGMAAGQRIKVRGPAGDAYLRDGHAGPILCIAGGSGLAPIVSILDAALASDPNRLVKLYFGARDERDVYLEDHFGRLSERHPNFSFLIALSQPSGSTTRRVGLVTDVADADLPDPSGYKAYLCGPPPMVDAARAMLTTRGIPAKDIHADAFYTAAERQAASGVRS